MPPGYGRERYIHLICLPGMVGRYTHPVHTLPCTLRVYHRHTAELRTVSAVQGVLTVAGGGSPGLREEDIPGYEAQRALLSSKVCRMVGTLRVDPSVILGINYERLDRPRYNLPIFPMVTVLGAEWSLLPASDR